MTLVSIDGEIVPPERATVSVLDRGFLYGDGLFEILRGVADLDAHLERLYASAAELALAVVARPRLAAWVREAHAGFGGGDARIRIVVTRGSGPVTARLGDLPIGRAIVIVEAAGPAPAEVSARVVELPTGATNRWKTLSYLDHLVARELAGGDEAIRLGPDLNISEGATSNVFVAVAGVVATPPLGHILPGVTRARVVAGCARLGIAVEERAITPSQLRAADEVFLTSSVRGVVPVTRLDGEVRERGPIALRIADAIARRLI